MLERMRRAYLARHPEATRFIVERQGREVHFEVGRKYADDCRAVVREVMGDDVALIPARPYFRHNYAVVVLT